MRLFYSAVSSRNWSKKQYRSSWPTQFRYGSCLMHRFRAGNWRLCKCFSTTAKLNLGELLD